MLQWIEPDQPLPAVPTETAPDGHLPSGLIAAGRDLSAARLLEAYSRGIFPWYTDDQPVLWWSPDPRMVLFVDKLNIRRSLKKVMRQAHSDPQLHVTLNQAFEQVMFACAQPRPHQDGTWITVPMMQAYKDLHSLGHAHSVEVWRKVPGTDAPQLIGGLYGVSIGKMFYGESMFTKVSDASKIAFVSLTHLLQAQGFRMIDCQQNTRHLASFGAREMSRADFLAALAPLVSAPAPAWKDLQIQIPLV